MCHESIRFLCFFFPSHFLRVLYLLFFFALPPIVTTSYSRNSDLGSHSSLSFPPSHKRLVPCIFIARRFQLFLPSSTRVGLCLPTLGALSSWSFFIFANKFRISPRRDSNSRTNTSSIRGLPLVRRGDRLSYRYTRYSGA